MLSIVDATAASAFIRLHVFICAPGSSLVDADQCSWCCSLLNEHSTNLPKNSLWVWCACGTNSIHNTHTYYYIILLCGTTLLLLTELSQLIAAAAATAAQSVQSHVVRFKAAKRNRTKKKEKEKWKPKQQRKLRLVINVFMAFHLRDS